MNFKNCGYKNDDKNVQCEVCGAELDNCQTKIDDKKAVKKATEEDEKNLK